MIDAIFQWDGHELKLAPGSEKLGFFKDLVKDDWYFNHINNPVEVALVAATRATIRFQIEVSFLNHIYSTNHL